MTKIKTQRLILRPLEKSDVEALQKIANNKKIWENLTDAFPHPYTIESAKQWVELNQKKEIQDNFAIKTKDELIGMIGYDKKKDIVETGYWIGEKYWGKGYATEALNAFTQYLINERKIKKIKAKVFTHNPASGRVLEKCGYKKQEETETTMKAGKEISEIVYIKE